MEQQMIEKIVTRVLTAVSGFPVGVSNRHIHLSSEHCAILFGRGQYLTPEKQLRQVGEFAARETVTLAGPKGIIQGVRVLGPLRSMTQVEISRTDGYSLGLVPPVRNSGDVAGSAGIAVVGPHGVVRLEEGVICAARHIHLAPENAQSLGLADGDRVIVEFGGLRGGAFGNTLVRVSPHFRPEFHIDTDEANAAGLRNGDIVMLRRCESEQHGK